MLSLIKTSLAHIRSHNAGYFYCAVVILIMGPLLAPGYILTLDMAWVPHITIPDTTSNTHGLYLLLTVLNELIASDVLQKLVLSFTLWGAGYGTYRLVRQLYATAFKGDMPQTGAIAAGLVAIVNPFTYDRFMDGHWQVLIGYAVLPWVTWRLMLLMCTPSLRNAVLWGVSLLILTSAGSSHMIPMGAMLCVAILIGSGGRNWMTRKFVVAVTCTLGIIMALNLIWLIPNIMQDGGIADKISSFDYRHDATFRTRGFGWIPPELNVLSLHGYWGESEGRFKVVQRENPFWLLPFTVIVGLGIYGFMTLWRQRHARRLALAIIGLGVFAWILSLGTYSQLFGWINLIFNQYIPFFSGYREPQKFAALLALILALLFGIGLARLTIGVEYIKNRQRLLVVLGILLPILYTPFLFLGTMNQLKTTDYPIEWYQLNERFAREGGDFAVVFLPWHDYFYFDPAGRTIANPSARFFTSTQVIKSEEPNIGLIPLGQQSASAQVVQDYLINQKNPTHTAQALSEYKVKYIVVAKIADWKKYNASLAVSGFSLVEDTSTTQLYRNEFKYGK